MQCPHTQIIGEPMDIRHRVSMVVCATDGPPSAASNIGQTGCEVDLGSGRSKEGYYQQCYDSEQPTKADVRLAGGLLDYLRMMY